MVYDIMAGSSAIRQSKTIRHFVHPKVTQRLTIPSALSESELEMQCLHGQDIRQRKSRQHPAFD
jgi:hypothetical protein